VQAAASARKQPGEGEDSELRCRPARAGLGSGGAVARERREKVDRGRCEIWVGEFRSDAGGMRFVFLVSDEGRWMDETWTCPMCFSGIWMIRNELLPTF
jgi:hypothetical protein